MINWYLVKFMGVIYIILALMTLGISFLISMICNLPIDNIFWRFCIFTSSIYWGLAFLTAIFSY